MRLATSIQRRFSCLIFNLSHFLCAFKRVLKHLLAVIISLLFDFDMFLLMQCQLNVLTLAPHHFRIKSSNKSSHNICCLFWTEASENIFMCALTISLFEYAWRLMGSWTDISISISPSRSVFDIVILQNAHRSTSDRSTRSILQCKSARAGDLWGCMRSDGRDVSF